MATLWPGLRDPKTGRMYYINAVSGGASWRKDAAAAGEFTIRAAWPAVVARARTMLDGS